MKKLVSKTLGFSWILLTLLLCGAPRAQAQDLNKLATDLAARIHALKHDRVTVLDFVDLDKKPNKLGKFLTQKLQAALAEPSHDLSVVDQSQLPQLFDQMEMLSEGLLDPDTGKQLGKVTGVEVVIVGTVLVSSLSVKLDVKAIDLQTAKLITGANASVSRMGLGFVDKLAKEAEGEDESLTMGEAGPSGTRKAVTKPVNLTPVRSRRDQGVVFDLEGCTLSGDDLSCAVTLTSEGRDRWLVISFDSRAWNEAGDEYTPTDATIANSSFQSGRNCPVKQILKNVPTHFSMTFPHFGEAASVERLRLFWEENDDCWGSRSRAVDFEKIDLARENSSYRTSSHSGGNREGVAPGASKGGGGLLRRLGERALAKIEAAATEVIDQQVDKVTGNDQEEEKKPPQYQN